MNIIWSKIVEVLESILIVLGLTAIPLVTPTPTPLELQTTPESSNTTLIEPSATLTPTPTPNIQKQIVELKEIIAAYTPIPAPSPIIIYVSMPTPLPVAAVTPTPLITPSATPEPTPSPTPIPPKVSCETRSGTVTGLIRCYSTFPDTRTVVKIAFRQVNDQLADKTVTIKDISGTVLFQELIEHGEEYEVTLNISILPENNLNVAEFQMTGNDGTVQVADVVWN